jgi:hypothetical protein
MIKRFILLTCLLAAIFNPELKSQSKEEIRKYFYEAESDILFEDYMEALPLYLRLTKIYPTNFNYKYRIGQCYINTPGEKDKAASFLEAAVKKINPDYKEGKFSEKGAPYDALYYLANAYRINNQLDKAIETYNLFKKNLNTEIYDSNIVNFQIQTCFNAKELMNSPLYVKEKNLGSNINEDRTDFYPVVSDNEDLLVFSKIEALYNGIFYSKKVNGEWSGPINMNELLKFDTDIYPTSISSDGKTLYLYSSVGLDGIIYTSTFENNVWSPLIKLNDNINTKYWESHATISHDNKILYFTSNRKGTIGGLDIYFSKKDSTGDWGPAQNLGPIINTPYNEESPFLSKDDKTLFFSSRGHFNMGGYDIFYSTHMDNGQWSVPLNVGYPLNTTDDDVFFKPVNEGYEGYFAKESPGGFGKQDIYRIEIFSKDHPRKFSLRGMVKVADLMSNINDSVKISAMNIKDPNQTVIVYSNPKTGEYQFELPQGDYKINYEGNGAEKVVRDLNLPLTSAVDSFVLPGTVLPKTDFVADLTVDSNKDISVNKGGFIVFPIKAEPNSVLTVERWAGDSLVSSEQFFVKDSVFNYKMVPSDGDTRVVFKLTDKFNNTASTEVFITHQKEITAQHLIRPEYSRVIAQKQIAALILMLRNRADDNMKKVIDESDIERQKFGKPDDLINYLKSEAAKKNISSEEVDMLALKVAVMDNVLTQAAVDLMAKYTDGELKQILSELDIYKANLKTWTDLQEYINLKTNGRITPQDLNKIAASILSEADPSIAVIRNKMLEYSNNSSEGTIIREAVTAVDTKHIKLRGKWIQDFANESLKLGLTHNQLADMLIAIGLMPGTDTEQFLQKLIANSEEPLLSSLKSIDLKKENIKTPRDLLVYLITNKDKLKYPEELVYKAIADIIISKDLTSDLNKNLQTGHKNMSWLIWILLAGGLVFIFFIFWKKNKEKEKQKK